MFRAWRIFALRKKKEKRIPDLSLFLDRRVCSYVCVSRSTVALFKMFLFFFWQFEVFNVKTRFLRSGGESDCSPSSTSALYFPEFAGAERNNQTADKTNEIPLH